MGGTAFAKCNNLKLADFSALTSIETVAFFNCSALSALIIRSTTRCCLNGTNAFTGTPIANGTGYIYVPSSLVEDYKADGLIIEQAKFCDFWGYERTLNTQVMQEEYGIPTLGIDRDYVVRGSGQLATRTQAFVESLEYKKLKKGGGA